MRSALRIFFFAIVLFYSASVLLAEPDSWRIDLMASGDFPITSGTLTLGVVPSALDSWDESDFIQAPQPPGPAVGLTVFHPEMTATARYWRQDFRQPWTSGVKTWNPVVLQANGLLGGEIITISWTRGTGMWEPPVGDYSLVDKSNGTVYSLDVDGQFQYQVPDWGGAGVPANFELRVSYLGPAITAFNTSLTSTGCVVTWETDAP